MADKGRLSKYIAFLLCWVLSFSIILILAAKHYLKEYNYLAFLSRNRIFETALPKNELGAFSYIHFDPKENYRPVYGIAFEKLLLINNNFGPFKTAMHKKAIIHNLRLKYYEYDDANNTADIASIEELLKQTGDILKPSKKYNAGNFNFSNVSEVCVYQFNYKRFDKNNPVLNITSSRATASYKDTNLILRGHVIIKTQDGSTLEGNRIKWNIKNQFFAAEGNYCLSRNNIKTAGRNDCFDAQLNVIQPQKQKGYAKLF